MEKKGRAVRPGIFILLPRQESVDSSFLESVNWNAKVAWEEKLYVLYNTIWYNKI